MIVVNSSFRAVPDADYLIFADRRWWDHNRTEVVRDFRGKVVALSPMGRGDHYSLLQRTRMSGLTEDPRYVAVWHTTVTAAINLACHLLGWQGEVGMLGLDGQDAPDGRMWHHEPHPAGWPINRRRYHHHGEALELVAEYLEGTEVRAYQCNPVAAHKMFLYRSFEEMTQ